MEPRPVCQIELRVRDAARAAAFYGSAFEWELVEVAPGYVVAWTGAGPVGGLLQAPAGSPLGATAYVAVTDCERVLAAAVRGGGHVVTPRTPMGDEASFGRLCDPWGNELGLWESVDSPAPGDGGDGGGARNGFVWLELPCGDLDEGVRFYETLFGWTFCVDPGTGGAAFCEPSGSGFGVGLVERAGACTVYVQVDAIDSALARLTRAGARIGTASSDRFATFEDPDGLRLGIAARTAWSAASVAPVGPSTPQPAPSAATGRDYRRLLANDRCWDAQTEQRFQALGWPADDCILQTREELVGLCEWMEAHAIRSYLEIGVWTGRLLCTLHRLFRFDLVGACDAAQARDLGLPLRLPYGTKWFQGNSHSAEYVAWRRALGPIDLVLIDADHTYAGVKADFEINRALPHRYLAFHDITGAHEMTVGVKRLWDELVGDKVEVIRPHVEAGVDRPTMGIGIWRAG